MRDNNIACENQYHLGTEGVPTLDQAAPGSRCRIRKVNGNGPVFQRLLEMGLLEGTAVWILRVAPLGDPMQIELNGFTLALRKSEAAMMDVDELSHD